jgi:immune inhibitor A
MSFNVRLISFCNYGTLIQKEAPTMRHIALAALLLFTFSAFAAPPPPWFLEASREGMVDEQQFREVHLEARARGVDLPNPVYGLDNRPFGPNGAISSAVRDEGMNVLILLVDFSDNVHQTDAVYFDSLGYASASFSLKNYYSEVSYGQMDITTVNWPSETGWQRAPHTYAYYVDGNYGWGNYPQNSQGLCADLCDLVDPIVDFSEYDNDGDSIVDGINIIFAGTFDGTPNTIWPHMWSLPGAGAEHDGVWVRTYSVQSEYNNTPGDQSAAVMCHEFGHILGLPDLYDYGYDSWGTGDWCLMSYGVYNGGGWSPAHLSAWCRISLGFATGTNVEVDGLYSLTPVENGGTIYRLWTEGQSNDEYFLVSNRRPIGYDSALPGFGVLIWHIDDNVSGNNNQWYPGHTNYGHYKVALEQADGLWELEQYLDAGDAGDPYPGSTVNRFFNVTTTPDSRDYQGSDTMCAVDSIPDSVDEIAVYLRVGVPSSLDPMVLHLELTDSASAQLTWALIPGATQYEIWRSTESSVDPSGRPWQTVPGTVNYLDITTGIGDHLLNYYYVGKARSGAQTSLPSNIVGEFDALLTVP